MIGVGIDDIRGASGLKIIADGWRGDDILIHARKGQA